MIDNGPESRSRYEVITTLGQGGMARVLLTVSRGPAGVDEPGPGSGAGEPPDAAAQTPQWQALPAETRHTLTKLMVRLIFGHADGDLARGREEMRHDV